MAYEVNLESDEEIVADIELNLSKKARPFYFSISSHALYIPRIKLIAKTDPFYFQKVPLEQVRHVAITRLRPYALWILAALMIVAGLITTVTMMEGVLRGEMETRNIRGEPIAVFICGFLVPFVARQRFALDVWFNGGKYRWKPAPCGGQALEAAHRRNT